jgi:hypothetical protein
MADKFISKSLTLKVTILVRLKRPIKNMAYLEVPKCTPDSLEISVNKIESLKGLNQLRSRTKQYYNYSNYTSITYTTLGYFYRPNRWHSAPQGKIIVHIFWTVGFNLFN